MASCNIIIKAIRDSNTDSRSNENLNFAAVSCLDVWRCVNSNKRNKMWYNKHNSCCTMLGANFVFSLSFFIRSVWVFFICSWSMFHTTFCNKMQWLIAHVVNADRIPVCNFLIVEILFLEIEATSHLALVFVIAYHFAVSIIKFTKPRAFSTIWTVYLHSLYEKKEKYKTTGKKKRVICRGYCSKPPSLRHNGKFFVNFAYVSLHWFQYMCECYGYTFEKFSFFFFVFISYFFLYKWENFIQPLNFTLKYTAMHINKIFCHDFIELF